MTGRRRNRISALAVLMAVTGGCRFPGPPTDDEMQRGLVWVFPGITGRSSVVRAVEAFRDAGVDQAIELHNWDQFFGAFGNLMKHERNRRDAAESAKRVATFAADHPDVPIDFVGYSGGGGMAVFTAEALPPEVKLRRIVLIQPALSPDYNLTAALEHVTDRLIHFHSRRDALILGLGTTIFGTMDRRHVAAAGKDGFNVERAVPDPNLRDRFEQRPWKKEMMKAGHWGTHVAIAGYRWNREYVAPLLRVDR